MGLLEDIEARQADAAKGCKYNELLMKLTAEERSALELVHAEINNEDSDVFSVAWLVKTLNDNGYQVGRTVVGAHLRGACACE